MKKAARPKRIRMPRAGAVVEIELPSGMKGYGRVLRRTLMAFYAVQSSQPLELARILSQPIAFKVWVMHSAITSGRWPVVGSAPLDPTLEESPWFFKIDAIARALSLYRDSEERPASYAECSGLECAAVWSAEHIEGRLQDHLDGKPNKWVEVQAARLKKYA